MPDSRLHSVSEASLSQLTRRVAWVGHQIRIEASNQIDMLRQRERCLSSDHVLHAVIFPLKGDRWFARYCRRAFRHQQSRQFPGVGTVRRERQGICRRGSSPTGDPTDQESSPYSIVRSSFQRRLRRGGSRARAKATRRRTTVISTAIEDCFPCPRAQNPVVRCLGPQGPY